MPGQGGFNVPHNHILDDFAENKAFEIARYVSAHCKRAMSTRVFLSVRCLLAVEKR